MKPEDIEKDRAIIAAATEEPWWVAEKGSPFWLGEFGLIANGGTWRSLVAGEDAAQRVRPDDEPRVLLTLNGNFEPRGDCAFIAAARTRWPAALDDLDASIRAIASAEDDAKHELEQADRGRPPDEYVQGYHAGLLAALKILRGEP